MISFSWHVAQALVRKRGSVGPWYDREVPVMLVPGEAPARQAQSARRILAQMELDARGDIQVRQRDEAPAAAAPSPDRAWQVESAGGDVLGIVFAATAERAAAPSAWGRGGFTLNEIVVELKDAWPNDAPGSVRVTARVGSVSAFTEIEVQPRADGALEHANYMIWATWNGLGVDPGFQRAVARLVDLAVQRRLRAAGLLDACGKVAGAAGGSRVRCHAVA